ncbi:hypothetical protein H4217_004253 [Coemansia sp. RSA 1939]|nr:hypothetical protein H4217_004253 [Coemansia sp. RSA 1939]
MSDTENLATGANSLYPDETKPVPTRLPHSPRKPPAPGAAAHMKANGREANARRRRTAAAAADTDSSKPKRPRMDADDTGCAKPRDPETAGGSSHGGGGGDWQLNLCSGLDETLQLSRRIPAGSDAAAASTATCGNSSGPSGRILGENTFDSYRLETLASAERPFDGAAGKYNAQAGGIGGDGVRWCVATLSADLVAIAAGSLVYILLADCRSQVATIRHDARILTTALSSDSSFVAFGDDKGMLFIVHIKSRKPVFSQNIATLEQSSCRAAKHKKQSSSMPLSITALRFSTQAPAMAEKCLREELVLTTANDTMVRFSSIRLSLLSKAIVDGDMELAATIKSDIRVEFVPLSASSRSIHRGAVNDLSVFHLGDRSHVLVAGDGGMCMSCWERDESAEDDDAASALPSTTLVDLVTADCVGSGYVKILLSLDHRYVVALSERGSLDVYDRSTLTLVFRYSEIDIDDFSLLAPGSSGLENTRQSASVLVALISKPVLANEEDASDSEEEISEEELCRRLLVVSLPTMEVAYSMDVSLWCWLAHDTRSSHDIADSVLFVEGTVRDGTQTFFLRSLNETVPLERLLHFLRAGRYSEAEAFAQSCNIPLSMVYRKRIEELLTGDSLDIDAADKAQGEHARPSFADKVLGLLGHLDDDDFIIDSCIRMSCPSFVETRRLLEYAHSLATRAAPASVPWVLSTIQRLGTWSMISSSSSSTMAQPAAGRTTHQIDRFDPGGWHVFRTADLAACLRSFIADGDVSSLGALWRRHCNGKHLRDDISSAIQGFSMDIDAHSLANWLRTEVLPTLDTCRQWHEVAVWIEQRARALASRRNRIADALLLTDLLDIGTWSSDFGTSSARPASGGAFLPICSSFATTPQGFIDNSISAAKWTIELARVNGVSVFSAQSDPSSVASSDSALQSCLFLRKQLLDLVYLAEKHSMVLSLEEFEQLSYSAIAARFLDRVAAPELLPEAYFDHFVPYSDHHGIDFAQILREYCTEMMDAVQRDDSDNSKPRADADSDDEGVALAPALPVPSNAGRHSWEPRALGLLSCLYLSCTGRRNRAVQGSLVDGSNNGNGSACGAPFPPLTSSRIGLLATYAGLMLEVMRRSSIPWSEAIDSAIGDATALLTHYSGMGGELDRCQREIKDQLRLMCLKRMLLSHGLADFHISNTRMAYPLLQWLVRKTDDEAIMADVLQLVDVYHHLSRTSAYVLRLQALCETGDAERVAALMAFIDETEYASCADTAIQRYLPVEVARRGLCWVREVLDNMQFGKTTSRVEFRQLAGAALAITRALRDLSRKYSRDATIPQPPPGSAKPDAPACSLAPSELRALQTLLEQETSVFSVVWQLLDDCGIMVSPGELDRNHTREQILLDLLEQHWLRAYINQPDSTGRPPANASGAGTRSAFKGKGTAASENALGPGVLGSAPLSGGGDTKAIPAEMLGLPQIPTKVKTLSSMLRFSSARLYQMIVAKCLSLGLYSMALDMCQQLIEGLKPLPHTAAASSTSDEWNMAIHALVSCERELSAFLANLASGNMDAADQSGNQPALSGRSQGSLISRLASVCQAACLKCASHGYIVSFLDSYACWELTQTVFSQITDGDFALLTKQTPPPTVANGTSGNGSVGQNQNGSTSRALPGSSSNATPVESEYMELSGIEDSKDSSFSNWLGPLFLNTYTERGLVLDTERTMHLTYRFVSALRWLPTTETYGKNRDADLLDSAGSSSSEAAEPKNKEPLRNKGSGSDYDYDYARSDEAMLRLLSVEDMRFEVIQRSSALAAHLAQNRHWILAVHVFELATSYLARSSFVCQASNGSAYSNDALDEQRQRLTAGGVSEDEMAAFFGSYDSAVPPLADVQTLVSKSLQRSLQQRGIDSVFIFSSMLMEPPAKAYQYLSTAMSHSGLLPARVIALANIGAACSLVWQQQALLDRCRTVAAAARWSEQLQLLQLKFDVALLNDPKPELLEPLVRPMLLKTGMDITTLLEFADAFRLDETFVVLEYILLCCSVADVDGYQARILGIAGEIANAKLLERTYVEALENGVSTYDYERLQFVVQRLHELRPQDKIIEKYAAVLDILCSYDRQTPPTREELLVEQSRTHSLQSAVREATTGSADADTADGERIMAVADSSWQDLLASYPLARKRIPFHSLVNSSPWTTLLPELSVETIELLLPLSGPLELSEDDFYMNLIDSMLKRWKADNALTDGVSDTLTAYELATNRTPTQFNTVQQLIRCFKDPEAAISTIKHLADELPCGPDRMAALKLGMKLLYKWGQYIRRMSQPESATMMAKAETIYFHFEKSYAAAKTETSLRRHGLEKYLPLFLDVGGGDAVIDSLASVFEGECEHATHDPSGKGKEPLHTTLQNLASIYDIGLSTLTEKLLSRYLEAPVVYDRSSERLDLPSTRYQATLRQPSSHEAVIRRRIVYILRIYPAADAVKYMMDFAYAPRGGVSCLNRARALAILFAFASDKEIAPLQAPESVRKYFQALLYLADFEHVGIPQTTADFLNCDKAALARSIWVDNHEDPNVAQLVCNMCLDFVVQDCGLLLHILPRLLDSGRFFYVSHVLSVVSSLSCYASIAELAAFWNQAVVGCFAQLVQRTDDTWIEDLFSVLGLSIRSRYLPDMDSLAIVRLLLQKADAQGVAPCTRGFQMACAVLDVFPHRGSAEQLFLGFIESMEPDRVHRCILDVLALSESARTSTMRGTQLFVDWETTRSLSLIFDHVDAIGAHELVLLRPPLGKAVRAFVQNRIRLDKLASTVNSCLERNKRQIAVQLVCQYYESRSAEVLAADARRAGFAPSGPDEESLLLSGGGGSKAREYEDANSTTHSLGSETHIEDGGGGGPDDTSVIVRLATRLSDHQKLSIYVNSHN